MDYPVLRIVRFSGTALTDGVEEHVINGVSHVTNPPAKSGAFNCEPLKAAERDRFALPCAPFRAMAFSFARANDIRRFARA